MKECPKCKHVLEDSCDFCPYCGQSLANVGKTEENKNSSDLPSKIINSGTISGNEKKEEKNKPLTEDEAKKVKVLRIVGICMGWCIVILPFIITGYSFGFFFYLLIGVAVFLLASLYGSNSNMSDDKDVVNSVLVIYIIIAVVLYIWGPLNPNYS